MFLVKSVRAFKDIVTTCFGIEFLVYLCGFLVILFQEIPKKGGGEENNSSSLGFPQSRHTLGFLFLVSASTCSCCFHSFLVLEICVIFDSCWLLEFWVVNEEISSYS